MQVLGFGQKTPPSSDGCIDHCNDVSPKTRTKGGGHHVLPFLIYAFPFKIWSQTSGTSMHGERNKYDCFNSLIEMIVKIH